MYQVILHLDIDHPGADPAGWDWTTLLDWPHHIDPVKDRSFIDRDPDVHFDDLLHLVEYIRSEIDDLVPANEDESVTVADASRAADHLHFWIQELEHLNDRYLSK